jgi:predicted transcriptional regulator
MNMITRNMNNITNNVISIVANIWNMKDTKAIPSHALHKIRNPSRWLASL